MFPLLSLLLIPCLFAAAQSGDEEAERAILLRGPDVNRGLPMYSPNIIPYYYGEYSFKESIVPVYFVTEEVVPGESWRTERCGSYTFSIVSEDVTGDAETIYYYAQNDRWRVFISVPREVESPCPFLREFIDRLSYFINITQEEGTAPLPAVLTIE